MRLRPSSRMVVALAAGSVAATCLTGPTTPAAAAVGKNIVVRGHGFGHGHGMSQYGAYGAARKGLDHKRILAFYYPGTTWGSVTGKVRVLISADTTRDLVVSPRAGLSVRDLGDGTKYPLPDITGVKRWRLNVEGTSTVVGYLTDRWRRWSPPGKTALVGDGQFQGSGPLTLWTPAGARTYRGKLRAASPTPGSSDRDTVNVVSMDTYVQGVIPAEMPASWPTEAVRAQAVAARTYASWSRAQNVDGHYQICDTTSCQVYSGLSGEDSRATAAVRATKRQILLHDGRPAFTQFSSSSGGWTSAGSMPYLPARRDAYDGHDANPVHSWRITVPRSRIEKAYPGIGRLRNIKILQRDGNGDWGGRVERMVLVGGKKRVTISGDTFRWVAGLRSSWFRIVR
jgi:stage II sporulation protein D